MERPGPILVGGLFPEILNELRWLLAGLSVPDWDCPTACDPWTVKDVALHLLGDEVGNLSRRRDGFSSGGPITRRSDLIAFVNEQNELWVQAGRRMSPRLICDLLDFVGRQACDYFQSLDPYVLGKRVSWAGPDRAPVWLDVAREYTERWLHQQHIRDAVGRPGLKEARYLAPVLDAFIRALPRRYEDVPAPEGTSVSVRIDGPSGGIWSVVREGHRWALFVGAAGKPGAEIALPEDIAWRVFTRGLSRQDALAHISTRGDEALVLRVLDTVSIIA